MGEFRRGDKVIEHYCIYKSGSNEKTLYTYTTPSEYEFFVGISQSFLAGKILVIYMMYRQSNILGEEFGFGYAAEFFFEDIIFEYFNPLKIMVFNSTTRHDFFIEDDKEKFKQKVAKELEEDHCFSLNYYNKDWSYQDYIDVGIDNEDSIISLHYQKYASNYNVPAEKIKQELEVERERSPNLLILNYYKDYI